MREREGGSSTYRFVCAMHNPFIDLPPSAVEVIEFRATTKHREEAPRLAVRVEKRAIKSF